MTNRLDPLQFELQALFCPNWGSNPGAARRPRTVFTFGKTPFVPRWSEWNDWTWRQGEQARQLSQVRETQTQTFGARRPCPRLRQRGGGTSRPRATEGPRRGGFWSQASRVRWTASDRERLEGPGRGFKLLGMAAPAQQALACDECLRAGGLLKLFKARTCMNGCRRLLNSIH